MDSDNMIKMQSEEKSLALYADAWLLSVRY